jgi:hypothetical protein
MTSYNNSHSVTVTVSWKQSYLEALRKLDKEKLAEPIDATEEAMFIRLQELSDSVDHNEERNEIHVACAALLVIKVPNSAGPRPEPSTPDTPERRRNFLNRTV